MPILSGVQSLRRQRSALLLSLVLALPAALACAGDNNLKPAALADPESLYWRLELNQHAVTLSTAAPYDTLTLVATPRDYRGRPLAGLPAPRYVSNDIEHVLVSPEGKLVAVGRLDNRGLSKVVATLTVGNLTHSDTVWVRVVDDSTLPILGHLSIHPVPPDSAKKSASGPDTPFGLSLCGTLPVYMTDVGDRAILDSIANIFPVALHSSDSTVATIVGGVERSQNSFGLINRKSSSDDPYPCVLGFHRTGKTTLIATASVLGITKADTLEYQVGWPLWVMVHIVPSDTTAASENSFLEPERRVGTGALVVWNSEGVDTETDVTFTDPNNVASVDTEPDLLSALLSQGPPHWVLLICQVFQADCAAGGEFVVPPQSVWGAARVFPVPGTYEYHTSRGARARIIVVDER